MSALPQSPLVTAIATAVVMAATAVYQRQEAGTMRTVAEAGQTSNSALTEHFIHQAAADQRTLDVAIEGALLWRTKYTACAAAMEETGWTPK